MCKSEQFVDYSSKDGTITKTVTTTQRDYYYIPPNTAQVQELKAYVQFILLVIPLLAGSSSDER